MYALCFAFGDSETVCVCPMRNLPDALLQLTLSSLHIFWLGSDTEVINIEVILNSRSQTLCDAAYFYIEPSQWQNTPLRDSHFLLVEIRKKSWSNSDLKFPIREITLYEARQSALQPYVMSVFHYYKSTGDVVGLLQIEEDSYKLFLDIGLSYRDFQFNHMIDCQSLLSESTPRIGDKFFGLQKSDQSFVGHMLHRGS